MPKAVARKWQTDWKIFSLLQTKTQLAEGLALASCHRASVPRKINGTWADTLQGFETKYTIITMIGMKDGNVPTMQIVYRTNHPFHNGQLVQWHFPPPQKTAVVCGQIVKGAVALSQENNSASTSSDNQLSSDDIATCMIGRLVDCMPLVDEEEHNKLQLRNAIFKFFTRVLNRDWLQLFLLIKELPRHRQSWKVCFRQIEHSWRHEPFQSLCSAYKACCPTSTVETAAKPVVTAKADNHK